MIYSEEEGHTLEVNYHFWGINEHFGGPSVHFQDFECIWSTWTLFGTAQQLHINATRLFIIGVKKWWDYL